MCCIVVFNFCFVYLWTLCLTQINNNNNNKC